MLRREDRTLLQLIRNQVYGNSLRNIGRETDCLDRHRGYYIVSDWEGEIFMIGPDNNAVSLLRTKDTGYNTADIEYVPEMKLLLVPTFFKNSVIAYKLDEVKN